MKRYLARFAHMVDGFDRLQGIMRTVYNQYDSMVRPLQKWLKERDVGFEMNTRVTDLATAAVEGRNIVTGIDTARDGVPASLVVRPHDRVLVTLGSMTEESRFGTTHSAPDFEWREKGDAWSLWRKIPSGRPEFGHPWIFCDHVDQSKWVSFTTTLRDPTFLAAVQRLTGNNPGEGGLITFPNSGWLLSIVIPHQPHFIGQPRDVGVFWGYGLSVDSPGTFVDKPMAACSGGEIMRELLGHLQFGPDAARVLETSDCIPCMMPYITSQFLARASGDRPQVIPAGWDNLAFVGQFCEQRDDVVFTVEYSVRSAQEAVYGLLGLDLAPPPVYQGKFDLRVLYKVFLALHDIRLLMPAIPG